MIYQSGVLASFFIKVKIIFFFFFPRMHQINLFYVCATFSGEPYLFIALENIYISNRLWGSDINFQNLCILQCAIDCNDFHKDKRIFIFCINSHILPSQSDGEISFKEWKPTNYHLLPLLFKFQYEFHCSIFLYHARARCKNILRCTKF